MRHALHFSSERHSPLISSETAAACGCWSTCWRVTTAEKRSPRPTLIPQKYYVTLERLEAEELLRTSGELKILAEKRTHNSSRRLSSRRVRYGEVEGRVQRIQRFTSPFLTNQSLKGRQSSR